MHAIRYLELCHDYKKYSSGQLKNYTLIAAFVNPGKVKEVSSLTYRNKDIANGYDSHHVKVTDGRSGTLGHPISSGYKGLFLIFNLEIVT